MTTRTAVFDLPGLRPEYPSGERLVRFPIGRILIGLNFLPRWVRTDGAKRDLPIGLENSMPLTCPAKHSTTIYPAKSAEREEE